MERLYKNESAHIWADKINENFESVSSSSGGLTDIMESEVFLGSSYVQDGAWIRQNDSTCPPSDSCTLKFYLPKGIKAKVYYGTNGLSTYSGEIVDGGTFTFPHGANIQRLMFSGYLATTLPLVLSGEIRVTRKDFDVIAHNLNKEDILFSLKRVKSEAYTDNRDVAPFLGHISDLHGDMQRAYNFFRYCKYYGIDDCLVTGDSVLYSSGHGNGYVFDAAEAAGMHVSLVIGNHEIKGITSSAAVNYTTYLEGHAEDLGYLKAENTITDRGYYYHDIPSKSLRVIVLDQYDGGVYGHLNQGGRISQGEIDFLINALSTAPAGYGIVIGMHAQESSIDYIEGLDKFNAESGSTSKGSSFYVNSSRPIRCIIDAFIGKTTYTGSYSLTYLDQTETINIDADFTEVDPTTEFICYLSGHLHRDNVGYLHGATYNQLIISMTCSNALGISSGSAWAFSGADALARRGYGVMQDAFNIYCIDRINKTVRMMRVGADMKPNFEKRDFMIVPYTGTTPTPEPEPEEDSNTEL